MSDQIQIVSMVDAVATQEDLQNLNAQALSLRAVACPVKLQRTVDPVWPEDERLEAAELSSHGRVPIPVLGDEESDAVLAAIDVALPDRLYAAFARPDDGSAEVRRPGPVVGEATTPVTSELGTIEGFNDHQLEHLVGFRIDTSFSAPDELTLRRLRLRIVLTTSQGAQPVAVQMVPKSDVAVDEQRLAQFELDFSKILAVIYPPSSGVFVARVNKTLEITNVKPRVQAAGLLRHECSWRISDPKLEYDFHPALVTKHQGHTDIRVLVELHVEVRKKVFGIWYRTYGKSAESMWYVYRPNNPVMSAFDYLHELDGAQELSGTGLQYEPGDDASAAMQHLGRLTEDIQGYSDAAVWYLRAAKAGNVKAMTDLGRVLERQGLFDDAKIWYVRAAALGDAGASEHAGNVDINRERWENRSRLQQLAEAGSTDAMVELAEDLENHQWPASDEAERWLRKAAEGGNDNAMFRLGQLIEERARPDGQLNKERAGKQAAGWYRQAANAGNTSAKRTLIRMHPWRFWYRLR